MSSAKKGNTEQEIKMQAILLAGGLGTRLRSVVSDRPKPMALIEDKPFMQYVTRELVRSGITEIIFALKIEVDLAFTLPMPMRKLF